MHRFELGACDRQTYRQTDRSHHRLVPLCVLEVGSQNNTYYFKKNSPYYEYATDIRMVVMLAYEVQICSLWAPGKYG